ncbi:hypothetical protein COBT_002072 [Conglomerata obtusa]
MLYSLLRLYKCSERKKDLISVVTNYDLKDGKDFDALALLTWNNFLLAFLHSIVLEGTSVMERQDEKIDTFLSEMFMPEEYEALKNLNAFIDKNNDKLAELSFDTYGYQNFVFMKGEGVEEYYLYLNNKYYAFIKKNKGPIFQNNSLLNFYTICFYRLRIRFTDYRLSNKNMLIEYHSVYQLNEKSCSDIFTDKVVIDDTLNYRLGLFILPVFNDGINNKQNTENFTEVIKRLADVLENQKNILLLDKNINSVYTFFLREFVFAPWYVESNYNIDAQFRIYDALEGCFWLSEGLYSFFYLKDNYFDTTIHCNPNYFKLDIGKKFKTLNSLRTEVKSKPNFTNDKLHLSFVDTNYNVVLSLLYHTISRLALKTFRIDTNEQNINYYFNKPKKAENVEEKEEDIKHRFKNLIVLSHVAVKEKLLEKSSDCTKDNSKEECFQDVLINQEEIEVNADIECDEITYVKILDICLLFYRELSLTLDKMEIENLENVFSIYCYVWEVIKNSEEYELDKKKIINNFYNGFVNKNLIINLFNSENGKNELNVNPSDDILSKNRVNIIDEYIKYCKVSEIINQFNLEEKKIKMIMNDSSTPNSVCDNDLAIYTILLKHGLKAVLNSYASYNTTTDFFSYLENIYFKINLKNIFDKDNNILQENNINVIQNNYNSINFQTIFEQESIDVSLDNSKPYIFYYNFYNLTDEKIEYDDSFNLSSFHQKQISYILNFSEAFLEKELNLKACHVFVFNIVYIQHDIFPEVYNTNDKSDYGLRLAEDYKIILNFIRKKEFKLPRCFIIKHDNIEPTMDTITFDGNPLSHYYKPILI